MAQYDVNNISVDSVLGWIKSGGIAIPEIQRPFVWNTSKVRDLIDSLYQGYPIGYIITWKNPDVKLKDGHNSQGKKILIDGQQRITAMTAALLGMEVVDFNYKKRRIKIAFNPIEEKFEVSNPAISKNDQWIEDISMLFNNGYNIYQFTNDYCKLNNCDNPNKISEIINKLLSIKFSNIGVIDLSHELDIETVTEIFIRINSQGVALSQADFAMSKISVDDKYNGSLIRKTIDYFCHLSKNPEDYNTIKNNDIEFCNTIYFTKLEWIRNISSELFIPDYSDLLRVAFTSNFYRGKLADLVSLLSGRDFETREYKDEIIKDSFKRLEKGVLDFINETNFKRYLMIIMSTGIINEKLIRSKNNLNFGYILYLTLKNKGIESSVINKVIRKWLVLSMLTRRYSSSPESQFDYDIKRFVEVNDVEEYVKNVEEGELSEAFWNNILISRLNTSVASSPYFHVYLMAQIKSNDKGFLSKDIEVRHLIEQRGDIHHIFPKKYLQRNGFNSRKKYNQIANYVYTQQEINIAIRDKAPKQYFSEIISNFDKQTSKYGEIKNVEKLKENIITNSIPEDILNMDIHDYETFLEKRRKMMALKIKEYYYAL